jgi:hypothetical protein
MTLDEAFVELRRRNEAPPPALTATVPPNKAARG